MKIKNKIIVLIALVSVLGTFTGCKKFLNVTPVDNLSGNNYWKSKADVEAYTEGIYSRFRIATMSNMFFPATGDFRGAPIKNHIGRAYLDYLRTNDLKTYTNTDETFYGHNRPTKWNDFFNMVQNANILYEQTDRLEPGILSETDRVQYRAEAVFLRNLAYFFMVRLYGDVPYYTNAYNSEPLPRTNMLVVLDKCIEDMMNVKDDLPWTFNDPSIVGIRAMRGGAIALLMHMNMWRAGFTTDDKAPYYEAVAKLGEEIVNNPGAYELLPLERTKEIFKGRSKEGLFEILQSLNYGERFAISATYADYVLHYPHKLTTNSYISYVPKFMEKLYPVTAVDQRKTTWFDEDIYDTDGKMQLLKYVNVFAEEGEDQNPDDNQIVFRYADAILLYAEALAELDRDAEARTAVNMIRERAGATEFITGGKDLKDDIYWERCRELMGEGHYFYDLVRTKKVIDDSYSFAPIGVDAFYRGAWTWPIDASAMIDNPYMILNNYWR